MPLGPALPAVAFRGLLRSRPVFQREWQWSPGPGAAAASIGIFVSKSAFGPGSMVTAGSTAGRREEASKGRAIRGPGNHSGWLLAGVALQVR